MNAHPQQVNAIQARFLNLKTGYAVTIHRCATTIGRGEENDVAVMNDQSISRQHALVLNIRDNYYIEDMGSRNGTWLNGKPVTARMLLKPGDQVGLGMTIFMFQAPALPSLKSAQSQTQDFSVAPVASDPAKSGLLSLRRIASR